MFWLCVIWIVNVLISWWNAYAVGKSWAETKAAGGWPRFMSWMGAIMADCGFSWCLLILVALGGHHFFPKYVPDKVVNASISAGFLLIGPAILFSGFAIMLDSWKQAFKRGGVLNYGTAAYNTYAQIHNSFAVIEGMGDAWKSIGDMFKWDDKGDDDNPGATLLIMIALGIVAFSLLGGTLLTIAIIRHAAGSEPMIGRDQMFDRGRIEAGREYHHSH